MTDYSVYLDDGGHPDSQPFLLIAGFAATVSQWSAFEPIWKATLKDLGLPAVFHMTDFMAEKRTAFQEERILSKLRGVIQSHTLRPFIHAVDMAAYKRVQSEFTLEESHGAPYALAGRTFMKELHEWQGQALEPNERTLVFVEEGTKHYGDLEQLFKRDKLPIPNRVPKFFGSSPTQRHVGMGDIQFSAGRESETHEKKSGRADSIYSKAAELRWNLV